VVVGTVTRPVRLDEHGYRATLAIERVLAGDVGDEPKVAIGWEEFDVERGSRFDDGERVLLALEPVPGQTLWVRRFPHRKGFVIGARFGAYLRAPDPATTNLLGAYLRLDPPSRRSQPGVTDLALLVAGGHPVLAEAAVARLRTIPGLAGKLAGGSGRALAQALSDPGRPSDVREALLGLAGERRLEALRPVIAPLAIPSDPLEAPALTALALLDDGIPAEEVAELLGRQQEAVRLVAVVHGADAISDARLATLLRNDPAAEVRAAAVANLLRRSRFDALDEATPALFDPEGAVRSEAALQIAALGPEVVPTLAALVPGRTAEDLTGVLAALRWAGDDGVSVLQDIIDNHPDKKVRNLALVTLGRAPKH
jgi:hypothetical protein